MAASAVARSPYSLRSPPSRRAAVVFPLALFPTTTTTSINPPRLPRLSSCPIPHPPARRAAPGAGVRGGALGSGHPVSRSPVPCELRDPPPPQPLDSSLTCSASSRRTRAARPTTAHRLPPARPRLPPPALLCSAPPLPPVRLSPPTPPPPTTSPYSASPSPPPPPTQPPRPSSATSSPSSSSSFWNLQCRDLEKIRIGFVSQLTTVFGIYSGTSEITLLEVY